MGATHLSGNAQLATVDGRNPAPPKKPWNDDSLVNDNQQWFPMVLKWCEMDFVHPQYGQKAELWLRRPSPVFAAVQPRLELCISEGSASDRTCPTVCGNEPIWGKKKSGCVAACVFFESTLQMGCLQGKAKGKPTKFEGSPNLRQTHLV